MRIVFDLQTTQMSQRHRGIGRYALSLVKAFSELNRTDDLIFLFNGGCQSGVPEIMDLIGNFENAKVRIWHPPQNISWLQSERRWLRKCSEKLYERFVASLEPDVLVVTSLFEGLQDDALIQVSDAKDRAYKVVVVFYDLIPLIHQELYLDSKPVRDWYFDRIDQLKRADHLLSISESSGREAINYLGWRPDEVTNISSAIGPQFKKVDLNHEVTAELKNRLGISRHFLMYTGGIDHRKNIDGLIRAYARLPDQLRDLYQLVIVCAISDESRVHLNQLALDAGLRIGDFVLTGYVSDGDLVHLYNLSTAFVFPSWHEGFGLPVLEAMACGKAVIGSNASSIPEVIGCEEALFRPRDEQALTEKIVQLLSDPSYRRSLEAHAKTQASKFSWALSAERAGHAIKKLLRDRKPEISTVALGRRHKPRLAYVSPLPPERSGIADYSAIILPALSEFYEIDVVVSQPVVALEWVSEHCAIRDCAWFLQHVTRYDRIVYNFGNSTFHAHMLELLQRAPGVVILHDFFLSGLLAHLECNNSAPDIWKNALYSSHGYSALADRINSDDISRTIWKYPVNLDVVNEAVGIIVHSRHATDLARSFYGDSLARRWSVIPLVRQKYIGHKPNRQSLARRLGLPEGAFIVCAFGFVDVTKLPDRLLDAWNQSLLAQDANCFLIFVGENSSSRDGQNLVEKIEGSASSDRIRITGWNSPDEYAEYLAVADLAVQLRTRSRGETSAAVLDCLSYGLPTIVNAHGSMAYLNRDTVWMIPDAFTDEDLVGAMNEAYLNPAERLTVSETALEWMARFHTPEKCGKFCADAIEALYARSQATTYGLLDGVIEGPYDGNDIAELAVAASKTIAPVFRQKQLFVDISELVKRDSRSGIQRVVRGVLLEWLNNPPYGYRVEPVYAVEGGDGYRYARQFTMQLLNCKVDGLTDEAVAYSSGDVFFGLDLQPWIVSEQEIYLKLMRLQGVQIYFMVYDLLPILRPDCFYEGVDAVFRKWLKLILGFDGVICESHAVSEDLRQFVRREGLNVGAGFHSDVCHIGADEWRAPESLAVSEEFEALCNIFRSNLTFLMVGTVEPRKGHALVLDAFSDLWHRGSEAVLLIVGKHGWMVDELAERITTHSLFNKKLYWLQDVSDGQLEALYKNASSLIAASEAEGFGLPIIEASQRGLSVIARDIPVFKEVAGDYAYYFSGRSAKELADDLTSWMALFSKKEHPHSRGMPWRSWELVAKDMARKVLDDSGAANMT